MDFKVYTVRREDWDNLFSGFCAAVKQGDKEVIPYDRYRPLKKGPKNAFTVLIWDNGEIYVTDNERYNLYSGRADDGSFGSYLFEYFQKESKSMHENEQGYNIWGIADSTGSNNTVTDTRTAWGNPYSNYTTIADSYQVLSKADMERIESLESKVKALKDKIATKVSRAEIRDELNAAIEDAFRAIDEIQHETRYEMHEMHYRIEQLEEELTRIASTFSKNCEVHHAGNSCKDNRKEKENMDTNKMFNGFEFGPVDDRVKMSPYGMAIRNAEGRYVSYDSKTGNIVDVEVFNFDNHNLIYKMPVAVSAIAVGDTVIHMKKPMFVTNVTNGITVIDIFNGEIKTIMPATNMFGFNFVTKVVSLFNFTGTNAPSAENPFGNVLPFMLMGDNKDFKDILPLMLMTGNAGMFGNMTQNPLMLYALMGDKNSEMDPLMMMALMGGFNSGASTTHVCQCAQHHQ